MKHSLENPIDFDSLENVRRFFIYGHNEIGDRLQLLLCGRFPAQFHGFLHDRKSDERHAQSQFSLRYWVPAIDAMSEGDFVFMVWRDSNVEKALLEKGIRCGLAANITTIYSTYEVPTFLRFCKNKLSKEMTALDIGANTGLTAAMMASTADRVIAFEPLPSLISVIKNTCETYDNICIENKAVYSCTRKVSLYAAGQNNTSMVSQDKTDSFEIEAVSVDDYCKSHNILPQFIKIDVEGVDAEVILGAEETLRTCRPILFLEHPKLNSSFYDSDHTAINRAMALIDELYDLYAYPTLDELSAGVSYLDLSAEEMMPLSEYEQLNQSYPTNIGALPK